MRIAILSEHFTKKMGYIENKLPAALARLGAEVHVVTSNLQVYHRLPEYRQTYEPFQGPSEQPCGIEAWDGYTLHRLPHQLWLGYVRIVGLARYLRNLKPDIVQAHAAASWVPLEAALGAVLGGYHLFTGSHQTVSAFSSEVKRSARWSLTRIGSDIRRAVPGRLVHTVSRKCYAATRDCAEIAVKYYGVPSRLADVCSLGVDTNLCYPASRDAEAMAAREALRRRLGFEADEVVCIYSGRMTEAKNPLCLARAIERLRQSGARFGGIFVGNGPQAIEIEKCPGCRVHGFVPSAELPAFYRAADVGVWPAFESMSMLDAAGCGIPIVVSDRVLAVERFEGNGLTYSQGDVTSLAAVLARLADPDLRHGLGAVGVEKIQSRFSWDSIARRRLADYESVLRGSKQRTPSSMERVERLGPENLS